MSGYSKFLEDKVKELTAEHDALKVELAVYKKALQLMSESDLGMPGGIGCNSSNLDDCDSNCVQCWQGYCIQQAKETPCES